MIILPAIDLYEGKAVRLYKGDYARMTVYSDDPAAVARAFAAAGAEWIHVVDLEGARDGGTPNLGVVREIARAGLKIELGGGLRSMEAIDAAMDAGAERAVLGTAAVSNRALTEEAAAKYAGRIAAGCDLKNGEVAVRGWTEIADKEAFEFGCEAKALGIADAVFTDIGRDGALTGVNVADTVKMGETGLNIIASGGIRGIEDLRALKASGVYGAILGRAIYTNRIDLAAAIEEM